MIIENIQINNYHPQILKYEMNRCDHLREVIEAEIQHVIASGLLEQTTCPASCSAPNYFVSPRCKII